MDKGGTNFPITEGVFYIIYLLTDVMDLCFDYVFIWLEKEHQLLNLTFEPGGLKQSDWSDMKCKMRNYGFWLYVEAFSSLSIDAITKLPYLPYEDAVLV